MKRLQRKGRKEHDDSCYDPDTGLLLDDNELDSPNITLLMEAMLNTQCGLEIPEGWTEVTATKKYYGNGKGTGEKVWRLEVPSPDWTECVSTLRYYTTPDGGVRSVWDLGTCAVDISNPGRPLSSAPAPGQ